MPRRDEGKLQAQPDGNAQAQPEARATRRRPGVRLAVLNLCLSALLVGAANSAFWTTVASTAPTLPFLYALAVLVLVLVNLFLTAITWGPLAKPALYLVIVASAAATYFSSRYGVLFDRDMIANLVQTDPREALELIHPGFLLWMLVFGLLPCVVLYRTRIVRGGWRARLAEPLLVLALSGLILGVIAATMYQPLASLVRNQRELRHQMVPLNVVAASIRHAARSLRASHTLQAVGTDARQVLPAGISPRRRVSIVVVGETARAANFSLLGYPRATNPRLAKRDLVVLRNVHACGTATATSVPCMFQDVGRTAYRSAMATGRENLLDVLQRAGIDVLWRENNAGCKHVCDRVQTDNLAQSNVAGICADGRCQDEILLRDLKSRIDASTGDAVIVLHMLGSHGPAYYKRYPAQFAAFEPTCTTSALERCTRAQIVNAYDNSIRYTDHVLDALVALLEDSRPGIDTALLYVSDHGESLGERGLYLHGLPYAIAPEEQTHVPMLIWLSRGLREQIDLECMRRHADRSYSHDNLYHSVLGLMHVQTSVYRPERDLFASCRRISD